MEDKELLAKCNHVIEHGAAPFIYEMEEAAIASEVASACRAMVEESRWRKCGAEPPPFDVPLIVYDSSHDRMVPARRVSDHLDVWVDDFGVFSMEESDKWRLMPRSPKES